MPRDNEPNRCIDPAELQAVVVPPVGVPAPEDRREDPKLRDPKRLAEHRGFRRDEQSRDNQQRRERLEKAIQRAFGEALAVDGLGGGGL